MIISLDTEELEAVAGVKLSAADINEFVQLLTIYAKRFTEPTDSIIEPMLLDAIERSSNPRNLEMEARRAFVDAVEHVWREAGGRGGGSHYNPDASVEAHTGPLLLLLQTLLQAIGDSVSPATLHHDIQALRTGRERDHGNKD